MSVGHGTMWPMAKVILGGEAVRAGVVTRHELARWYTPLFRGVFIGKSVEPSLRDRAIGAWLATGRKGTIAGLAAAALHGAPWIDADVAIEVAGVTNRSQAGLVTRTDALSDDEVVLRSGLPVTSRVRTAFDLGRLLDRGDALARLDGLMWNQHFEIDEVVRLADRRPRLRGIPQLRELLPLVDGGAASLRESMQRLWLLDYGFPRPQTQIPVSEGHKTHRVPRHGMAQVQGGGRIRRRPSPQRSAAVRQRHRASANAGATGLDRHPSHRRRPARRLALANRESLGQSRMPPRDQ